MRARASLGLLLFLGCTPLVVAGTERPAFPAIELRDAQGQPHALAKVLGKATVLNFWAIWCGPCRVELPELQQLYNELGGKGFAVLAINVDSPRELVGPFMQQGNLTLPVYFLDMETRAVLGIDRLPLTVLLDRDGKVVRIYAGYSGDGMRDLRQQVVDLLGKKSGRGGK